MDRLLKLPEVLHRTGLSRSSVYKGMSRGDFPRPLKTGPQTVGWRESEVQDWIETRERAAYTPEPPTFTPDEVTRLEAHQEAGDRHPFTCPEHDADDHPHGVLVPTVRGLICPFCDYKQDWARGIERRTG